MNRGEISGGWLILALFVFTAIGIVILLWLGRIPDEQLTTAHATLIGIADWLVKMSVGAILGLRGSAHIKSRKGGGTNPG